MNASLLSQSEHADVMAELAALNTQYVKLKALYQTQKTRVKEQNDALRLNRDKYQAIFKDNENINAKGMTSSKELKAMKVTPIVGLSGEQEAQGQYRHEVPKARSHDS